MLPNYSPEMIYIKFFFTSDNKVCDPSKERVRDGKAESGPGLRGGIENKYYLKYKVLGEEG